MKREFLKGLELTDEQINAIMAENGKDINAKNEELENTKQELTSAKETITKLEASKTDSEAIAKELESYKSKTAELEKTQLETKRAYKLKELLNGAKAKNTDVVAPLLSELEFDGENFKGFDEKIKALKESSDTSFLFDTEQKPPLQTGGTHGNTDDKPLGEFEQALAKLNPNIKF